MVSLNEHYVVEEQGNRIQAVLDIDTFRRIIEELEKLDELRAFDAAKAEQDERIPFRQGVDGIDRDRNRITPFTLHVARRSSSLRLTRRTMSGFVTSSSLWSINRDRRE